MIDKKCKLIESGQQVSVPYPQGNDTHKHRFVGTVIDILESRGTVIVKDQCDEYFEVQADTLIIREN